MMKPANMIDINAKTWLSNHND